MSITLLFLSPLNIESESKIISMHIKLSAKAYTLPHTNKTDIVCWNKSSITNNEHLMTQIHVVCLAGYQNQMNGCYANATEPC